MSDGEERMDCRSRVLLRRWQVSMNSLGRTALILKMVRPSSNLRFILHDIREPAIFHQWWFRKYSGCLAAGRVHLSGCSPPLTISHLLSVICVLHWLLRRRGQ